MSKLVAIALGAVALVACRATKDAEPCPIAADHQEDSHTAQVADAPLHPATGDQAAIACVDVEVPNGGPAGPHPLVHVVRFALWDDGTAAVWNSESSYLIARLPPAEASSLAERMRAAMADERSNLRDGHLREGVYGPHSSYRAILCRDATGSTHFVVGALVRGNLVGPARNDVDAVASDIAKRCRSALMAASAPVMSWSPRLSQP